MITGIPIWVPLVTALVGALLGGGGIASIKVARINAQNALPAHLTTELRRQDAALVRERERMDSVEAHLVVLGDHVDLLENHIWKGLPPPPPPRPVYRPYRSPNPEE